MNRECATRWRGFVFLVAALATGLGSMAGFYAPSAAAQQAAVSSPRVSALEGAGNFRDIGGYATTDGRRVRHGVVYRSNRLSELTASDYQRLGALGIRMVCDFRTDDERQREPTAWQGTPPEMMRALILTEDDLTRLRECSRELPAPSPAERLIETYERMVTERGAKEYGRLYKRIVAGAVPLIAHCTAGKDRTGMFSAFLLTLLGVPRSGVLEDYMLTGEYMRGTYTMYAEVLTSTFATIDRLYGSFDAFVRDGLGLTASDIDTLRTRLLE